jgi:hypothetical protein
VRLAGTSPTVHRDIRIVGNTIGNFADAGIHLSTSNTAERFEGVEISGNEIYADNVPSSTILTGIRLARPGNGNASWLQGAVIANNRIGATIATQIERHSPTVPFVVIAGNSGDRSIIEGDGDPEGRVTAPFGSLYVRIDTEVATALYLKTTGTGPTGWAQITHQ